LNVSNERELSTYLGFREENEDRFCSLNQSNIEFVPTRHDQEAAFIADVWGRSTGEAGVCLGTLGPGATNLLTGVADANLDRSPVVAITGQGDLERLHQESHQNLDIINMFEPVTKWNNAISHPDITAEFIWKAFKKAEVEKPGAAHVEPSEDVAKKETHVTPLESKPVRRANPDQECLREAIDLLQQAEKLLIIAGNGVIRSRCAR